MLVCAFLLIAWSGAVAQGGAAVITLVMPPPGGDGYNALQTGGAFSTGAASLYYNPALLAELHRATGSQVHLAHSRQDLLPGLGLSDLNQNFTGLSFVLADGKNGFDMGVGFFRNHVNFGESLVSGEDTAESSFKAGESVYGLGLGLRLGGPLSVGGTVKYYDSHLSPGARAIGFAFDLGILALQRVEPLVALDFRSLEVTPSMGYSWLNHGPDAWYVEPSQSDPIPRYERASMGLQIRLLDAVEIAWGKDWEKETHRRASREVPVVSTYGYTYSVLGYRYYEGKLDDPLGGRIETHASKPLYALGEVRIHALEFNMLQVWRVWRRAKELDYRSSSEAMEAGYPFKMTRVLGVSWRMNPQLTIGKRVIRESGSIREGQEALYWSVSL
jgi:hypothetical protein